MHRKRLLCWKAYLPRSSWPTQPTTPIICARPSLPKARSPSSPTTRHGRSNIRSTSISMPSAISWSAASQNSNNSAASQPVSKRQPEITLPSSLSQPSSYGCDKCPHHLGLSSKYLHAPLAVMGMSLLRNRWAFATAAVVGPFAFFIINRVLNPLVFTGGFHWLVSLATHKGIYGEGEAGFIDFNVFWPNMAAIITAAPVISAVFMAGAFVAVAQMLTSRRYLDPISLTLVAAFLAFAAQLVATSKHFNLHYMLASWVLTGGVLVLTVIETRRLFPRLSPRTIVGSSALVCTVLISTSLLEIRSEALRWIAFNNTGAKLSKAVMTAGPSCANVSGMFVRAPDSRHPANGGSLLRSLCARLQGAAA